MTAATPDPMSRPLPLVVVSMSVAVALATGAAMTFGGSGETVLPLMADQPIEIAGQTLQVMKYEVTLAEWDRCYRDGGCELELRPRPGQDPAQTPATGLSYSDASAYIAWINATTGEVFRLPTASEWQHMARPVLPDAPEPLFTDPQLDWASSYYLEEQRPRALLAQGSNSTTAEGVSDLDGNVWEWTQDCYAGTGGGSSDRCPAYLVAGEHMAVMSFLVRDPARGGCAVGSPPAHLGMRLVRDVD